MWLPLDDASNALSQRQRQQAGWENCGILVVCPSKETAEVLDVSAAALKRDWNVAKRWLPRAEPASWFSERRLRPE